MSCLKVGTPLNEIYDSTKKFIVDKDPSLADKLHSNFGFGIGCDFKEDLLLINSSNTKTLIQPGMVFHVRITIMAPSSKKNEKGIVAAIGDTVMI
jgi:nucleosome binding factor SPN SPT16 subunit